MFCSQTDLRQQSVGDQLQKHASDNGRQFVRLGMPLLTLVALRSLRTRGKAHLRPSARTLSSEPSRCPWLSSHCCYHVKNKQHNHRYAEKSDYFSKRSKRYHCPLLF